MTWFCSYPHGIQTKGLEDGWPLECNTHWGFWHVISYSTFFFTTIHYTKHLWLILISHGHRGPGTKWWANLGSRVAFTVPWWWKPLWVEWPHEPLGVHTPCFVFQEALMFRRPTVHTKIWTCWVHHWTVIFSGPHFWTGSCCMKVWGFKLPAVLSL